MKTRMQPREKLFLRNKQVRREIQRFLQALDSYPDRFARNPGITFEQHLWSLVSARQTPTRRP